MSAAVALTARAYKRGEIDYDSIDAANFSTIKLLAKSPRHYKAALDGELVYQTNAMRLGLSAHTAALEPGRFTRDYAVYEPPPPDPKTGKPKSDRRGTNAWKDFETANEGRIIIKQAEFDAALRVREAVRGDATAMRYMRKGHAELTLVWQDAETGIWCKCRLDFLSESVPHVDAELKTTAELDKAKFFAAYARNLYHAQAAMQIDALNAVFGGEHYHKCIAVESKEPFDVVVYNVIGHPLEAGRDLYRGWLSQLADCRRDNEWPGRARGGEVELRLPGWAGGGEDEDLEDLDLDLSSTEVR